MTLPEKLKNYSNAIFLALLTIASGSCTQSELPEYGIVTGTVMEMTAEAGNAQQPVAGEKFYLLPDQMIEDTIPDELLVDSAFSNSKGEFVFTSIPFGNYRVGPVQFDWGFHYEPADADDSNVLELTPQAPERTVNFHKILHVPENSGQKIQFELRIRNQPQTTEWNILPNYYTLERKVSKWWSAWFWDDEAGIERLETPSDTLLKWEITPGFEQWNHCVTNHFKLKHTMEYRDVAYGSTPWHVAVTELLDDYYDIGFATESVVWEYDWKTNEAKKIK